FRATTGAAGGTVSFRRVKVVAALAFPAASTTATLNDTDPSRSAERSSASARLAPEPISGVSSTRPVAVPSPIVYHAVAPAWPDTVSGTAVRLARLTYAGVPDSTGADGAMVSLTKVLVPAELVPSAFERLARRVTVPS